MMPTAERRSEAEFEAIKLEMRSTPPIGSSRSANSFKFGRKVQRFVGNRPVRLLRYRIKLVRDEIFRASSFSGPFSSVSCSSLVIVAKGDEISSVLNFIRGIYWQEAANKLENDVQRFQPNKACECSWDGTVQLDLTRLAALHPVKGIPEN